MGSISRIVLVSAVALAAVGCATKSQLVAMRSGQGEAMPVIHIAPGYVERVALMDRYRLHDEDRRHMMARPHVWVEEVSDDELPAEAVPAESAPAPDDPLSADPTALTGR